MNSNNSSVAMLADSRKQGNRNQDQRTEVGILLSDVEPERVEWLWPGRIPLGKLTILEGDPDKGKSVMTLDFAARVTTGRPFPSDQLGDVESLGHLEDVENLEDVGGAVIISAEDGLADTIRPRLDAAGADVSKVVALTTVPDGQGNEREISIPQDLPTLEKAIERVNAKLVIVDPLSAFMSGDINKDQDVRRALTPFARLAEEMGCAVVVLRHFTKNVETNAIYRGGGSIGIIGAARSAMAVAPHPDDEDQKVLVPQKNNLSKKLCAIAYTVVEGDNGAPRTKWGDTVDLSNEDVLKPDISQEKRSEVERAKTWIADKLKDGPVPSKAIEAMADEDEISNSTLERAKTLLPVRSKKVGKTWCWVLVEDSQDGQGTQPSQDSQDSRRGQGSSVDNVVTLPL